MKNILVPTDFSAHAHNAVCYALQLAKTLKANVHLCHCIVVPAPDPNAGGLVWPIADYTELKETAELEFVDYLTKIKADEALMFNDLPSISYSCEPGTVKQVVDEFAAAKKMEFVVMGMAGAGNVIRFFLGSNSRDLIEHTSVPVLLIPKNSTFSALKKIGFATDLKDSDLNSIYRVARLFCLYNPEILLSHISDEPSDFRNPNSKASQFLNKVTCKINYSKIYYRHIKEVDTEKGLTWLTQNGYVDMLAMIHRKMSFLSSLVTTSHTQKMAKHITIPLLVLPEEKQDIGW